LLEIANFTNLVLVRVTPTEFINFFGVWKLEC